MTVVPLRKSTDVSSARREEFLTRVAAAFDGFVEVQGEEPEALCFVFGGLKQSAQTGWLVMGASEGGASACLALAGIALQDEVFK